METFYDWITVGIFSGLIVLYLDRSLGDEQSDELWQYLLASVGCAVSNYLGNEGYELVAVAVLATVIMFVLKVLKPFDKFKKS